MMRLYLTPEGQRMLGAGLAVVAEVEDQLAGAIDPDGRRRLLDQLEALRARASQVGPVLGSVSSKGPRGQVADRPTGLRRSPR
jgi:hypothetical protein